MIGRNYQSPLDKTKIAFIHWTKMCKLAGVHVTTIDGGVYENAHNSAKTHPISMVLCRHLFDTIIHSHAKFQRNPSRIAGFPFSSESKSDTFPNVRKRDAHANTNCDGGRIQKHQLVCGMYRRLARGDNWFHSNWIGVGRAMAIGNRCRPYSQL
jgi:hypothetical protein